jgi:hypothetical protein
MWTLELSELSRAGELLFLRAERHFRALNSALNSVPRFQNCRKGPHYLLMASFALLPRQRNLELHIAM